EPKPGPARRVVALGAVAVCLCVLVVPLVRAARARAPERVELDPTRVGAESIRFDEYVRALFTDPSRLEHHVVAWPGTIDALAHFAPGAGDARSALTAPRPYGRTLCAFQVDGSRGPLDGRRVFLEVPDELGFRPPARSRAVVKARIETNLRDPSRERPL